MERPMCDADSVDLPEEEQHARDAWLLRGHARAARLAMAWTLLEQLRRDIERLESQAAWPLGNK